MRRCCPCLVCFWLETRTRSHPHSNLAVTILRRQLYHPHSLLIPYLMWFVPCVISLFRFAAPGAQLLQVPIIPTSGVWAYWLVGVPHVTMTAPAASSSGTSVTIDLCPSHDCTGIVDTGTSFIATSQFVQLQMISLVRAFALLSRRLLYSICDCSGVVVRSISLHCFVTCLVDFC